MHPVLERVVCQIAVELNGADAETTQIHPLGLIHKWNAQQIIEHLILGYRETTRQLETRLSKGHRPRNVDRTSLQWLLQLMILSFGKLPSGVPAMEETMPAPGRFGAMSGRQLDELLRQEMEALDSALDRCRRKFGMERVAHHPLLGPLRVDQWRRFHVVHGLHHLAQVRAVIQEVAPAPVPVRTGGTSLVKELQVPIQRPLA
ncbi:MAG: DUF1569 domain-containing protein [Acidobacteriaceae bacterium]